MRAGYSTISYQLFAAILAVLSLVACAPQRTEVIPQPSRPVDAPPWNAPPWTGPLSQLGLAGDSVSFEGPVLIWDPDVTPEAMGDVLKAVRDTRLLRSAIHDFERGPYAAARLNVQTAEDSLRSLEQSAGQRDSQLRTAALWYAKEVQDKLQDELSKAKSKRVWERWCEAKIWDMASWKDLALDEGSPAELQTEVQPMCADFYRERNLLIGPGCTDKLSCLWLEGVLRTEIWQKRLSVPLADGRRPSDVLISWLNDGTWRSILAQTDLVRRASVRNAVMGLRQVRIGSFNVNGQDNNRLRGLFAASPQADLQVDSSGNTSSDEVRGQAILDGLSPEELLNVVESTSLPLAQIQPETMLVPGAESDSMRQDLFQSVREALRLFAARQYPDQISVADALVSELPRPALWESATQHPLLAPVFDAGAEDSATLLTEARAKVQDARTEFDRSTSELRALEQQWTDVLQRGLQAASREGATQALWPRARLRLQNFEVLSATLSLDPELGSVTSCAGVCEGVHHGLELDEASGRIRLVIPAEFFFNALLWRSGPAHTADEVPTSGDTQGAERTNGFSELAFEDLRGAVAEFELDPGQVGAIAILSGKMFIKRNGRTLYEGATSFLPQP